MILGDEYAPEENEDLDLAPEENQQLQDPAHNQHDMNAIDENLIESISLDRFIGIYQNRLATTLNDQWEFLQDEMLGEMANNQLLN